MPENTVSLQELKVPPTQILKPPTSDHKLLHNVTFTCSQAQATKGLTAGDPPGAERTSAHDTGPQPHARHGLVKTVRRDQGRFLWTAPLPLEKHGLKGTAAGRPGVRRL